MAERKSSSEDSFKYAVGLEAFMHKAPLDGQWLSMEFERRGVGKEKKKSISSEAMRSNGDPEENSAFCL